MLIGTIKIISRKVVKSMKEYGKVRSTKQPEQKVIDDYSVWIAENITPVTEAGTDEQPGFTGYEYDDFGMVGEDSKGIFSKLFK